MTERRSGFALLTVLCVMTIASSIALAATLVGRDAFTAERNRIQLERAWWRAAGCAARARAALDAELSAGALVPGGQTRTWRSLDQAIAGAPVLAAAGCTVSLEAAGTRLDVNAATPEQIERALVAAGIVDRGLELRDALLDWLDADDETRPSGAEEVWYLAQHRPLPANGPLSSTRELSRIRGFEAPADAEAFAAVISTDAGRISIPNASAAALSTVPGFTPAVVQRILDLRAGGQPIYDLLQVVGTVPSSDASEMMNHYPEITRLTTLDPDAWILTSRARADSGAAEVRIEQRLLRNGSRVVAARTRVMP